MTDYENLEHDSLAERAHTPTRRPAPVVDPRAEMRARAEARRIREIPTPAGTEAMLKSRYVSAIQGQEQPLGEDWNEEDNPEVWSIISGPRNA